MEINRFEEVLGCLVLADVVEGRFGLLAANSVDSIDFGSRTDLPGFRVPATAEEAKRARFVITWQVDNREPPYYNPAPQMDWSMRKGGWDQEGNVPFTSEVWLTYPGYQNSKTIPSGTPSLAFGTGSYTIPSGQYIYNAALKNPGAPVVVANTAEDTTDAGKPKYQATMDERVIGIVEHYDTSTGELTIRVK